MAFLGRQQGLFLVSGLCGLISTLQCQGVLEAGWFAQRSRFKSQFWPSYLCDFEEALRLHFPIHEMGIVGPGHKPLKVGARLPFTMRPHMKVFWQLTFEDGHQEWSMPHPGTLSPQTREAFPKWQCLEQALIIPGFPSFPQACIRGCGFPVMFSGGHPEHPCGGSVVHVPVILSLPPPPCQLIFTPGLFKK